MADLLDSPPSDLEPFDWKKEWLVLDQGKRISWIHWNFPSCPQEDVISDDEQFFIVKPLPRRS